MEPADLAAKLAAPFDDSTLKWRVGTVSKARPGKARRAQLLAYIDSRAVQERLDSVVGPFGWRNSFDSGPNGGLVCLLELRNPETGEWVGKTDGADNTQIEATKGGLSDAFKRAAVAWGIGRYLYALPSPWVEIKQRGDIYVSEKGKPLGYCDPPKMGQTPAPQRQQQPAPKKERAGFAVELAKIGWTVEKVDAFLVWSGGKPSAEMSQDAQFQVLQKLAAPSPAVSAKVDAWEASIGA